MTCFSIQKSLRFTLVLALAALACLPAMAQSPTPNSATPLDEDMIDAPIVVELFTAADCSACIYADRILYDAMKDKNVIALSCRVEDVTALDTDVPDGEGAGAMDPCVFRQWTFASLHGGEDVTMKIPTFYFNGKDPTTGADIGYLSSVLRSYHYKRVNNTLEAMMRWKDKDTISIHLPEVQKKDRAINASVWILRYKDISVERIDSGVNKDRVLRFSNIVQSITHVAKWHGNMRVVDVDVPPPPGGKEKGGYAVIVAELLGVPYLAAGSVKDYPVAADIKAEAEKRAKARAAAQGKPVALPSDKPQP